MSSMTWSRLHPSCKVCKAYQRSLRCGTITLKVRRIGAGGRGRLGGVCGAGRLGWSSLSSGRLPSRPGARLQGRDLLAGASGADGCAEEEEDEPAATRILPCQRRAATVGSHADTGNCLHFEPKLAIWSEQRALKASFAMDEYWSSAATHRDGVAEGRVQPPGAGPAPWCGSSNAATA